MLHKLKGVLQETLLMDFQGPMTKLIHGRSADLKALAAGFPEAN